MYKVGEDVRGQRKKPRRNFRAIQAKREEFANIVADPKAGLKPTTTGATEKSNVATYLQRPYDNAPQIAATIRDSVNKYGVLAKVIDYYQSLPTYNFAIKPILGNKVYDIDTVNMRNDYIDIAYALEQYNIKYYAPIFFRDTLIEGVTFYYKIEDSDGISFMKFPIEWCKIRGIENGVYRFMIDVTKFKQDFLTTLPEELQTAYEQYQNGNATDENSWYNNRYYFVSEKGVAFTFDSSALDYGGLAVSPFAGVLLDIMSVAQAKNNVDIKDGIDTTRILHSKIPVDNDGRILMTAKEAKVYDSAIRSRLPKGVVNVTTPTKLENVPLTNSGNTNALDTVKKSTEQLFFDVGTPAPLFGGDTTSANIVKTSIQKDANWVYTNLFPLLENYYNSEIAQVKTKGKVKWAIKFVRQTTFTLKDDVALQKDQLSYGGSRLNYLAANGFSPSEIVSQLSFEQQALGIDDLMIVKPTSNTISANEVSEQGRGRPVTDNPTDDTDRLDGEK